MKSDSDKSETVTKPEAQGTLAATACSTADFVKEMWGNDWYGRLLLICGVLLIPGAIIIALVTDPRYILLWVNGLTAVMLLGRCAWRSRR